MPAGAKAHPHGARWGLNNRYNLHSGASQQIQQMLGLSQSRLESRLGSCQLLMGVITGTLPALPQRKYQPTATLKVGPRLLLKLMKKLKKNQKQLMKTENLAPERTLTNLSPLSHPQAPLPWPTHTSSPPALTGWLPLRGRFPPW